jgi:hypothetical protein
MARRDLLVAGLAAPAGGLWKAVLAAGRLAPELHNALPRLGGPGGGGGRETQAGGRHRRHSVRFDIARAALRRTTSIVTRLAPLATGVSDEPPAAVTDTFAGAVLQTVAAAARPQSCRCCVPSASGLTTSAAPGDRHVPPLPAARPARDPRPAGQTFEIADTRLKLTPVGETVAVGGTVSSTTDGIIGTRRGNPSAWTTIIGKSPVGTWELCSPIPRSCATGSSEEIADIVLVVTCKAQTPAWPA